MVSEKVDRQYKWNVVTNVRDITALRDQLEHLSSNFRQIQISVGMKDDPDAEAHVPDVFDRYVRMETIRKFDYPFFIEKS